jgi:hypothetical protein
MAIRITCSQCTTAFTVNSDQAGLVIACPNCFKKLQVSAPTLDTDTPPTDAALGDDAEYTLSPAVELPARHAAPTAAPLSHSNAAPTRRRSSSPAAVSAGSEPVAPTATTCSRCGKVRDTTGELCPHCFYHSGLKRVIDIRDHDDPLLAEHGFRRYLLTTLNKDQSPESVFFLIDAMVILSGILLYVMGHSLAVVMVPVAIMYLIYRIAVRVGRLWYNGRSVLWFTVLVLGRSLSWRTLGGQDRKHATRRGTEFGDAELDSLADLESYVILDLEGTAITDSGLAPLKNRGTLQFLILRKTQVTPDGVWELQQTIPHVCIWF